MNDEIKEILDNKLYFDLDEEDYIKIKDYITNLQQENERLKELDENYPIEEQLEEALKYENIYKSRCEKASNKLSFIDEALENNTLNVPLCITKINSALNILQNGSDE